MRHSARKRVRCLIIHLSLMQHQQRVDQCCDDNRLVLTQVAADGSVRCGCDNCARWKLCVRGKLPGCPPMRQYEVLTAQLVEKLASYIRYDTDHLACNSFVESVISELPGWPPVRQCEVLTSPELRLSACLEGLATC